MFSHTEAGLFPESGFCRNRGNGSNQGTFPRSFPLPAVFFDRRRDNGTSSEPDRKEIQAWDGDDRLEMKTEKDRDTGKLKTGPSHPVGTISCRMDETFLLSIEPDGSSGFRHGTDRRTGSNGMHERTIVPVSDMAETDGVLENCLM